MAHAVRPRPLPRSDKYVLAVQSLMMILVAEAALVGMLRSLHQRKVEDLTNSGVEGLALNLDVFFFDFLDERPSRVGRSNLAAAVDFAAFCFLGACFIVVHVWLLWRIRTVYRTRTIIDTTQKRVVHSWQPMEPRTNRLKRRFWADRAARGAFLTSLRTLRSNTRGRVASVGGSPSYELQPSSSGHRVRCEPSEDKSPDITPRDRKVNFEQ